MNVSVQVRGKAREKPENEAFPRFSVKEKWLFLAEESWQQLQTHQTQLSK